jgi:Cytochrome P460
MGRTPFSAILIVVVLLAVLLAVLGSITLAAQDRFTLQVPNGLAFSEFRGYENWQDVAVSQTENALKVIAANDAMINAYRQPGNGKPFPEGSKIVKIEWSSKKNPESPYFVMVPDTLKSVSFIEKDTKRFPDTNGWAYAQFVYDAASDTFKPNGNDAKCGYACHTTVAAKDYIFTAYPPEVSGEWAASRTRLSLSLAA